MQGRKDQTRHGKSCGMHKICRVLPIFFACFYQKPLTLIVTCRVTTFQIIHKIKVYKILCVYCFNLTVYYLGNSFLEVKILVATAQVGSPIDNSHPIVFVHADLKSLTNCKRREQKSLRHDG